MERQTIYFYDRPSHRVNEKDLYLNNYFLSSFIVDNKEYKTVEHYYQASKFSGQQAERVRLAPTPDEAKKLAHEFQNDEQAWESRREEIMRAALKAKFDQNHEMRQKLIESGDTNLVEDSPRDAYWGGSLPGSRNRLGILLEELREKYRNE